MTHVHGTANTKCRHPDCRAAMLRYQKRWKYERLQGITRTTDPEKAALYVAGLYGQGWSARAIAGAAACSPSVVTRLLKGSPLRISKAVEKRLLAVSPDALPSRPSTQVTEPFVSRVGTVRRLQALQAIGWSSTELRKYGIHKDNLLNQQGRWVTRSTHDRVAAVYRKLCTKPGPSEISRRRAAKSGYLPPVVWDNIDMDEAPEPEPEEVVA